MLRRRHIFSVQALSIYYCGRGTMTGSHTGTSEVVQHYESGPLLENTVTNGLFGGLAQVLIARCLPFQANL